MIVHHWLSASSLITAIPWQTLEYRNVNWVQKRVTNAFGRSRPKRTPMPRITQAPNIRTPSPSTPVRIFRHYYPMAKWSRRLKPLVSKRGFQQLPYRMSLLFSHNKGTQYTLETTTAEQIQDLLSFYRLQRWGFVIYRCTYGNDDAWASFMRHLNQRTKQHVLTDTYDSPNLAGSLDWNVQEDQSLDGASKDEVRRRFKQWVASSARAEFPSDLDADKTRFLPIENPRYNYCIHVDRASLNSVVKHASQPDQPDLKKRGWVNLIRADESWDYPDFDRFN